MDNQVALARTKLASTCLLGTCACLRRKEEASKRCYAIFRRSLRKASQAKGAMLLVGCCPKEVSRTRKVNRFGSQCFNKSLPTFISCSAEPFNILILPLFFRLDTAAAVADSAASLFSADTKSPSSVDGLQEVVAQPLVSPTAEKSDSVPTTKVETSALL